MADSTINGLTALAAASVVPGTDVAPVWQGSASTTKKVTIVDLVTAGNTFGTIAANAPATISQTWNNAAVTFTGKLISITDTASNASSLLQDWQVGGSSKASISKAGNLTVSGNLSAAAGNSFLSGTVLRIGNSNGDISLSGATIQIPSTTAFGIGNDTFLNRESAGVMSLKNSTTAQEYRVYKSTTGPQYKAILGDGNLMKISGYAFTNGSGASAGTLSNAPAVGNPTKWIPIDDNGTTRYIPAW